MKSKSKYELEEAHVMFRDEPTEFELNAENANIDFKHLGHEEGEEEEEEEEELHSYIE